MPRRIPANKALETIRNFDETQSVYSYQNDEYFIDKNGDYEDNSDDYTVFLVEM
jgi:hypothetical protein